MTLCSQQWLLKHPLHGFFRYPARISFLLTSRALDIVLCELACGVGGRTGEPVCHTVWPRTRQKDGFGCLAPNVGVAACAACSGTARLRHAEGKVQMCATFSIQPALHPIHIHRAYVQVMYSTVHGCRTVGMDRRTAFLPSQKSKKGKHESALHLSVVGQGKGERQPPI